MKLLLVDDDADLLDVTTYALRKYGYEIVPARDGLQALERWETENPALVLLDIGLPRLNGLDVCRRIRQESRTPVIMLTARGDEESVVQGFQNGADDYVAKPFSNRQLAMRIRAVLQRSGGNSALMPELNSEVRAGGMQLNVQSHEVTKDGKVVQFTPLEFRILYMLAVNEGRVVTSSRLIEYAWNYDGGDPWALKTHMCHIRQKLWMEKGQPGYIRAVPRLGYVLTRA